MPISPPSFLKELENISNEEHAEKAKYYETHEYRHNPSSCSYRLPNGKVIGACVRQLYWRATKQKESNPTDFTGTLQMGFGDAIHTWLLHKLSKSKTIKITAEASGKVLVDPLTTEVSFRLDGLCTYDGTTGCLEIKTQQSYAVERMTRKGEPPKLDHIAQVLNYFETNPAISWCSLIYFARDSGLRAEYHITKVDGSFYLTPIFPTGKTTKIDHPTFKGIVDRWVELETHLKNQTLPDRDYKVVLNKEGNVTDKRTKNGVDYKSDYRCMYCGYCDYCWSLPDAKSASINVGGT